jgi:hypothetical protein
MEMKAPKTHAYSWAEITEGVTGVGEVVEFWRIRGSTLSIKAY